MSYIIGLKIEGTTAIISDTRVTFGDGGGQDSALKTGNIFPGCIYGGAGDADAMRIFIQYVKLGLTTKEKRSFSVFWDMFTDIISTFRFEDNGDFELILSSRHSGIPELYYLNSKTKSLSKQDDFITIGSGKAILDNDLFEYISATKNSFLDSLKQNNFETFYYPYFYCLWLMERGQGVERPKLQDIGVGGIFHYSYQTDDTEHRQQPAVYVLNKAFGYEIYSYIYHVTFEGPALIITNPGTEQRALILDSSAWIQAERFTPDEIEELGKEIFEKVDKQPYYLFCGFGFLGLPQRGAVRCHFVVNGEYAVSKDGKMVQDDVDYIKYVYSVTT